MRLEGGYTNPVAFCGICIYTNAQYNSGYNNDGRLIGTWIGRAAQGEQIRSSYWLGPRKKIGQMCIRDRLRYVPCVDRARAVLGLRPTIGLEEGIRRTARWYEK